MIGVMMIASMFVGFGYSPGLSEAATRAHNSLHFILPSRDIECQASWSGTPADSILCQGPINPAPSRPPGCKRDYGSIYEMDATAQPEIGCFGGLPWSESESPTVSNYGTMKFGGITCDLEPSSIRCTNLDGYGFLMSKGGSSLLKNGKVLQQKALVSYYYSNGSSRPFKISPTAAISIMADNTIYVWKFHWGSWGQNEAKARAALYVNTCKPDCARGKFRKKSSVQVRLFRPIGCGIHRVFFYMDVLALNGRRLQRVSFYDLGYLSGCFPSSG
jgi:hypothetical protein